jgi:hypothetical protein
MDCLLNSGCDARRPGDLFGGSARGGAPRGRRFTACRRRRRDASAGRLPGGRFTACRREPRALRNCRQLTKPGSGPRFRPFLAPPCRVPSSRLCSIQAIDTHWLCRRLRQLRRFWRPCGGERGASWPRLHRAAARAVKDGSRATTLPRDDAFWGRHRTRHRLLARRSLSSKLTCLARPRPRAGAQRGAEIGCRVSDLPASQSRRCAAGRRRCLRERGEGTDLARSERADPRRKPRRRGAGLKRQPGCRRR